jgi:hypothetical protein
MSPRASATCVAAVLALALAMPLAGCGRSGGGDRAGSTAGEEAAISMSELAGSVEAQAERFIEREGSVLHRSLTRFLGDRITAGVSRGTTECRPGRDTPSIADPRRFPFACVVEGSADGGGLTVNIALGFVGLSLDGRCWQAANERVTVTATAPALLPRRQAMRQVNRIAGCA